MADEVNEVQEKLDELAGALHAAHNSTASVAAHDLVSCSVCLMLQWMMVLSSR